MSKKNQSKNTSDKQPPRRKLKVLYTYNLQTEDSVKQAEFDTPETIEFLTNSLKNLGHEVFPLDVNIPVSELVGSLEKINPDIVFNTAEGVTGKFRVGFYPALFELMKIPYTGSDAYVSTLTLDKGLTKVLLQEYKVLTPKWEFVDQEEDINNLSLSYPLIVKPNFEGSSKGIDQDSVVTDYQALLKQVKKKLKQYPDGLLVEEYIEGKDIAIPFLESLSTKANGVLSPIEYIFDKKIFKNRKFDIYDYQSKHELDKAVTTKLMDHNDQIVIEIKKIAKKIFKALNLRDFARIDFRLTKENKLYFIEINSLPSLQEDAGLHLSASKAGLKNSTAVVKAILSTAYKRYNITSR